MREATTPGLQRRPPASTVRPAAPGARGWSWPGGIVALAAAGMALKLAGGARELDLDLFHSMAWFREALATGAFPKADVWSYAPTRAPLVHHEWGTGAVLYVVAVATGWGLAGVAALRLVLYGVTVALACAAARRRGATGAALAVTLPLALALFAPGLAPVRAQLFTFLFVALLMLFTASDWRGARRWTLAWLLACAAWVNLHGGFVAGFGLFALHVAERFVADLRLHRSASRALCGTAHLWATGAAMALLILATPYGWQTVPYLRDALSMERPLVSEWAPVWSTHAPPAVKALYLLALLFLAYAAAYRRTGFPGLSLLLAAGWMAAQHKRFLPLFAVVWLAHVPAILSATPFGQLLVRTARHRGLVAAGAAAVLLASLWNVARSPPWSLRVPTEPVPPGRGEWTAPGGAVDYLRASGFRGNLMTTFEAGAYVMWHLHPHVRVSMDSRYEAAYPPWAAEASVRFYSAAPGWRRILARDPADAVLVPFWSPLASLLVGVEGWRRVYRDDSYSVFVRSPVAGGLPLVDRRGEPIAARFP